MAVEVFYTWDIAGPGSKLQSDTLTHQAGDFAAFVEEQFAAAERATTEPDVHVEVEVFVNSVPKKVQSDLIGEAQREVLWNVIANEHSHRGGKIGTEGAPTREQMHAENVEQPIETDGDQGPGNPDSDDES